MKKNIFYLLLFLSNFGFSQLSSVDVKGEEFKQFKASKTYIVLSGDKKYDSEIVLAANTSWKVTAFETITSNEFKTKITDKTASFILLVTIEGPKPQQNYHYLALINGGKKSITKYHYDDLIAYCPINFFLNENKLTECSYRLRNMMESMVQAIDVIQQNEAKGGSLKLAKKLQEIYLSKASKIKERTLLVCQESIGAKLTKEDFAANYPFKFEFCTKEKIEKAIKDKSTEYYYLQPAITLNKSIFVFDPSNGEVVYFEYAIMGLAFNKGDLKDLVEKINGKK